MRRFEKLFPILFLAAAFAVFTPALTAKTHTQSMSGQSKEHMTRGELLKVDTENMTFTVKSTDNKEVLFRYDSDTKVEGSENGIQGLSSETGTKVAVWYRQQEGHNMATRIEIQKSKLSQ